MRVFLLVLVTSISTYAQVRVSDCLTVECIENEYQPYPNYIVGDAYYRIEDSDSIFVYITMSQLVVTRYESGSMDSGVMLMYYLPDYDLRTFNVWNGDHGGYIQYYSGGQVRSVTNSYEGYSCITSFHINGMISRIVRVKGDYMADEYLIDRRHMTHYETRYPSGAVERYDTTFSRDPHMVYLYYESGAISEAYGVDSLGLYCGPYTSYYENGQIESQGEYLRSNRKMCTWTYYDALGNIYRREEYDCPEEE